MKVKSAYLLALFDLLSVYFTGFTWISVQLFYVSASANCRSAVMPKSWRSRSGKYPVVVEKVDVISTG
jgi:hypothetical protein